jgi:hypothetical protein
VQLSLGDDNPLVEVGFSFQWTFDSEARASEAAGRLTKWGLEGVFVRPAKSEAGRWTAGAMMTLRDYPQGADEAWLGGYLDGRYDGFCGEFTRALSDLDPQTGDGDDITFVLPAAPE